MSNCLIIVESPTKAKIINKFLGSDYQVVSSMGHVRDLPVRTFGIDIDKGFKPEYVIVKGKGKFLKKIKELAKKTDKLYLAMDEDREGEAIGWHVMKAIGLNIRDDSIDRIVFHEITEEAIREALSNPRKINMNLVDAQQGRRLLDRLVGYKISPLISRKIRRGLSAGRVQSVGLKMIVNREKERRKFKPRNYYTVEGMIEYETVRIETKLWGRDGKKFEKFHLDQKEKALDIIETCRNKNINVKSVTEKIRKNYPSPPFITSTLQQESFNSCGFTPQSTMRIAQQLYEGIELSDGSSAGLVTYMRTDSVKIANVAINGARKYISDNIGSEYLPEKLNTYRSRSTAQEAHECIRPTSVFRLPDDLKSSLSDEQYKIYKLIWERFIACQMKPAVIKNLIINLECAGYDFIANGQSLVFDGYTRVCQTSIKENDIPRLKEGTNFNWKELECKEHETKPPPRYTPATLVSELEKNGIGRPSTYAAILNTLFKRKYIHSDKGSLVPEDISFIVVDSLEKYFSGIMDKEFTAKMETNLDEIAEGKLSWQNMLKEFYVDFEKQYNSAFENMEKIKDEKTDKKCPACSSSMVIRWGRNGKFIACSAYPKCKQTFNIDENGEIIEEKKVDLKCPKCTSGLVVKKGRYGDFLACSSFPECKTTVSIDENGEVIKIPLGYERCPKCGKDTVIRVGFKGKFLACTGYPKCKFAEGLKKLENKNG